MLHQCHCYVPCTHKKNIHIYKPWLRFPPACMQHQCDIWETWRFAPLGTQHFALPGTQCFAPLGTRRFTPLRTQCFAPLGTRHFVPLGTRRCACPTQSETCYALCLALQEKYEQTSSGEVLCILVMVAWEGWCNWHSSEETQEYVARLANQQLFPIQILLPFPIFKLLPNFIFHCYRPQTWQLYLFFPALFISGTRKVPGLKFKGGVGHMTRSCKGPIPHGLEFKTFFKLCRSGILWHVSCWAEPCVPAVFL